MGVDWLSRDAISSYQPEQEGEAPRTMTHQVLDTVVLERDLPDQSLRRETNLKELGYGA